MEQRRINPATLNRLDRKHGGGYNLVYNLLTERFSDQPYRRTKAFQRFMSLTTEERDAFIVQVMIAKEEQPEGVWLLLVRLDNGLVGA